MIKLLKVTQSAYNDLRQLVVTVWNGKSDTRTAKLATPSGVDANPIKNLTAVYAKTEMDGKEVLVGFINTQLLADVGELRLFATDSTGTLKGYTWLKNNGELHLLGETNFAVKFNELATEFNALKTTVNNHISAYNTHVHPVPGVTAGPASTISSVTTSTATANTSNINNAKNERIKTN